MTADKKLAERHGWEPVRHISITLRKANSSPGFPSPIQDEAANVEKAVQDEAERPPMLNFPSRIRP